MINEALKLVRVYHNLNQKKLADALDLSPSYLNEIESGKKQVTMDVLEKYSKFFKIPTSSLLYFAERKGRHGKKGVVNPIAAKAIKMLDWVDTITRDIEDEDNKVSA
jgi:transcriptional regulator with XRE-family HTH domain